MTISTARKHKKYLLRCLAVLFWLLVWQAASAFVAQDILLVSPVSAVRTLIRLMGTGDFYLSVATSFGKILLGFSLAVLAGAAFSGLSLAFSPVKALLDPPMSAIKATPVASFVILALVWIRSRNLSVFISFLMVLPVIYFNLLAGLESADGKLLEMARLFRVGRAKRVRGIYLPAALPYFLTACRLSMGMCWKAGIAAEVIAQPPNSIGDKLYRAKLFLSTDELFAWTLAIVLISVALEKLLVLLFDALGKYCAGGGSHAV